MVILYSYFETITRGYILLWEDSNYGPMLHGKKIIMKNITGLSLFHAHPRLGLQFGWQGRPKTPRGDPATEHI